jgi:hypothetical protein
MTAGKPDGVLMASITATILGYHARYWVRKKVGRPPQRSDLETFVSMAAAVAHVQKVAASLGYPSVHWLPHSEWRSAEIEHLE